MLMLTYFLFCLFQNFIDAVSSELYKYARLYTAVKNATSDAVTVTWSGVATICCEVAQNYKKLFVAYEMTPNSIR